MDTDDLTHSRGLRAKAAVAQETTNEQSRLSRSDIKIDQPITGMAEPPAIKVVIACEEGRTTNGVKKSDDLVVVIHSEAAKFATDASKVNAPPFEFLALPDVQVFVENDHAAGSRTTDRHVDD